MILPDFLVINENGLFCPAGGFYLDPTQPVSYAVVSHAHGDHAVRGNGQVYCTAATRAFMELRYKKMAGSSFETHGYREPFFLGGVELTFLPAGHILGSAQVLMEYDGCRYLYTGDIKLQPDRTCEPAEFCSADVLISETTFADPAVIHPDVEGELQKLNDIPYPILLGAYSLGKSQRLAELINRFCPAKRVVVHHSIVPLNKIYEAFSYPPGKYELYNRKLQKSGEQDYIYIVPPLTFNSYFKAKNLVKIFASGWERLQVRNGTSLYISDHADWNDLLRIIETVRPAEIWTLHGDGRPLAKYFEGKIMVKILNG